MAEWIAHSPSKLKTQVLCFFLEYFVITNFSFSGTMKIAEVSSRFVSEESSLSDFVATVKKFGFELKWKDEGGTESNRYFVLMDFKKTEGARKKLPEVALKPCIYKKR